MGASLDTDDPREYAEASLERCTLTRHEDDDTLIGLPNPYVVPNTSFFEELYYWDSYFTIVGLLELDRTELAKGMVENCFFLLDEYGFVPNGNRTYYLSRSQPPFLAPMVTAVGDALDDDAWLAAALPYLEREYESYWTERPHLVPETGLSRYYDASGEHEHAEDESGWDLTPRFQQRANDFLPVCLNSYLYGYETTIAALHERVGDADEAPAWRERADRRRAAVDEYLWDDETGLYFDYDYVNGRQSPVRSLATFTPLWTGLASDEQADRVVAHLDEFEHAGGLVTCDENYGAPDRQ